MKRINYHLGCNCESCNEVNNSAAACEFSIADQIRNMLVEKYGYIEISNGRLYNTKIKMPRFTRAELFNYKSIAEFKSLHPVFK